MTTIYTIWLHLIMVRYFIPSASMLFTNTSFKNYFQYKYRYVHVYLEYPIYKLGSGYCVILTKCHLVFCQTFQVSTGQGGECKSAFACEIYGWSLSDTRDSWMVSLLCVSACVYEGGMAHQTSFHTIGNTCCSILKQWHLHSMNMVDK